MLKVLYFGQWSFISAQVKWQKEGPYSLSKNPTGSPEGGWSFMVDLEVISLDYSQMIKVRGWTFGVRCVLLEDHFPKCCQWAIVSLVCVWEIPEHWVILGCSRHWDYWSLNNNFQMSYGISSHPDTGYALLGGPMNLLHIMDRVPIFLPGF